MKIEEVDALEREPFVEALGFAFEDSPWVARRAWERRPFGSLEALHRAMIDEVARAGHHEQLTLLRSHPDLGASKRMSAASVKEQAGAGLDHLAPDEFERLRTLNHAYREKFGFPFLFAVKGSTRRDILNALVRRFPRTEEEEFQEALEQVYRIAWFRLEGAVT
jgi:2-oxo-4-hydroxy-4-carboxy-5-ureidoimidazoline decarboxylase